MNEELVAVDHSEFCKMKRAITAVSNVHNAPLLVQPISIIPPVSRRPAVVHVKYGESTRCPVLDGRVVFRIVRRRWSAMNLYEYE